MNAYEIVAYPAGERTVVHSTVDRCAEAIVAHAANHARVRGEFVDVLRDGRHIAVVGRDGPVPRDPCDDPNYARDSWDYYSESLDEGFCT